MHLDPVLAGYVTHLAERIDDDGLLHLRSHRRRETCAICEAIKLLPLGLQLTLVAEVGTSAAKVPA